MYDSWSAGERRAIYNDLVRRLFEPFMDVSDQDRHVEGFNEVSEQFDGPLCTQFRLNRDHIDFGEVYEALQITAPFSFGIGNFDAFKRENDDRQNEHLCKACSQKLIELRALPDSSRIMNTRIEMKNFNSPETEELKAFIKEHIPLELLSRYRYHWKGFFRVSNKVWEMLVDSLRR